MDLDEFCFENHSIVSLKLIIPSKNYSMMNSKRIEAAHTKVAKMFKNGSCVSFYSVENSLKLNFGYKNISFKNSSQSTLIRIQNRVL